MVDFRIPLNAARYNDIGRMIERGNTRVRRRKSTTSYEFGENGSPREVLLESGGPEKEATIIARYLRTGRHLGKFDTPRAADAYARSLEDRAERLRQEVQKARETEGDEEAYKRSFRKK